jgi:hypothetical protein
VIAGSGDLGVGNDVMSLGSAEVGMTKDGCTHPHALRVFLGDGCGGAIAEQMRIHVMAEPRSGALDDRLDRAVLA